MVDAQEIIRLFNGGTPRCQIAKIMQCHQSTISKILTRSKSGKRMLTSEQRSEAMKKFFKKGSLHPVCGLDIIPADPDYLTGGLE